jgi:pimeloyl-ACP methyl ester carboxylesterase
MTMRMNEQTLDTGAIVLNHAENDHSGSALMFIHGITLSWQHLSVFIEPLSRTHHVFAPDLRGHGKSSHSSSGYPLDAYVDDVVDLMNQRVREPAVIIGASLGALVAIGVAAALPEMTRGVVLLDPPLIMRDSPFDAISYSDAYALISMIYQAVTTNEALTDIARRIQQLVPELPDDFVLEWAQSIRAMDPVAVEYFMDGRLLNGFDLEDTLRHIRCPALLLCGEVELGGLVRETDMEHFTSLVENGTAIRLTGAGHGLPETTVLNHLAVFLAPPRSGA